MTLTTLNKDIQLVTDNHGKYDFQFVKNDLKVADGLESYRNAVIIAILTGYQELNKTNNPTYADFGDKAYQTIKRNKSKDVIFELESYITEVVTNMRRTNSVEEVQITDSEEGYNILVKAISITDEQVVVTTTLTDSISKLNTVLYAKTDLAYCNKNIPLIVDISLKNYEDNSILKDIVYIYINNQYIKTLNLTGETTQFKYTPTSSNEDNVLKIVYKGNPNYNSSEYIIHFISET